MIQDNPFWERDDVQFSRLLAEIKMVGLTPEQLEGLKASMNCTTEDICELLDRAEETFEAMKEQVDLIEGECCLCGGKLKKE